MAYLDPNEAAQHLQDRVLEGIRAHFPLEGKTQTLHLDKLEVSKLKHPDDLRGQHAAKVAGDSWAAPVYAHLTLKDKNTGAAVDQRRVRIAELPLTTSRYSYILDGQEYQVDNQWQLKSGVYSRRRPNGELENHFNVTGKGARAFDTVFDPAKKTFSMQYGSSKASLPLYPFLKTLGVSDGELEKAWGKEVLDANKNARGVNTALEAFYKTSKKTAAPSKEEAAAHFHQVMGASNLRPDATEITLGKPFSHVTGDTLKLATEKLLKVSVGHPEDDRDSLVFKDLRTTGDYAFDKLREAGRTVRAKTARKIDGAKDIREIIKFDMFNTPVRDVFHKNSAARVATQINPVEMVSSAMQTTIMGTGGIKSERSIEDEAKFVNPSHLGYLDPINTPEGAKTGVTLRLPLGVRKEGNEAKIRLYNLKTNAMEMVSPTKFATSNIILPDQIRWEGGTPKPLHDTVRMSAGTAIRDGKVSDAQYAMPHAWQLFNMTSNLVPFLGNTSGGRASMASRQMEQAISLVHRQAPLVQVGTGMQSTPTFEALLGKQASHQAPVSGKVVELKKDAVVLQDAKGQHHEVQLYNNYPLNDAKGVLHSTPLVKVGDKVTSGQVIADTNYARNGVLALGTNLRTAYIPFKGYNFEDGIVISESAAQKLSSAHLQKNAIPLDDDLVLNKKKFHLEHPGVFKKEQLEKLDDSGVVRIGQTVHPGDPLIAAMKPYNIKDRTGLAAIRRSMSGAHTDKSLRWDSEFPGEVVGVHKGKDGLAVHVRTIEPMQVGDKMAGRYGNKGIVTMILPDQEMPHTKDGKHIEVALNPSGVPGRMNVGQLLETAAGKIVEKTGKPYIVKNFEPNTDALGKVRADLKAHGLTDTEELFDPVTKQPLGKVMVGPQHHLKLVHQVEKKLSVRSGMNLPGGAHETYDLNLQPASGSGTGGQSMGTLGLYALLAHGATANIREMQTYKAEGPDAQTNPAKRWPSDHDKIWAAIQTGGPLPTPKPTFAFQKFTDMLKGSGINIEKKGHDLVLSPLTDAHIKQLAKKELPNPADLLLSKTDKNGDPMPKPGGLFDEHLTGGHGGRQWTRIGLAEPLPNPLFEAPIRHLTGLSAKDFTAVIHGEKGVAANGGLTDTKAGVTGGAGIKLLLDRIDVAKELPKAEKALQTAKTQEIDKTLKKVKYLRALKDLDMKPSEAYILHNIPVIPPVMRPVSTMPSGALKFADINQLYSDFAKVNDQLKNPTLARHTLDENKKSLRQDYYDGVKAIIGLGTSYADAKHKGLLHQVAGSSPKNGYFQDVLVNRRQDMTMRSTIVPEPALGLDEVGLPKNAALDLYRPFVVRKLKDMGAIQNELQGPALISKQTPAVWRALDKVMEERPVLLKRDPALHKYSVQAFKPKPVEGNAIKIHPLVTGGFNADFDGDTMSAYVPITREAVAEAHKMFPSNNLFSEATGQVMYQPTLESALGLYKLSLVGKDSGKSVKHPGEAVEAVRKGTLHVNDIVHLNGKPTTAGRILMASAVPSGMQQDVLHKMDYHIDKSGLNNLLTRIAKDHTPEYGTAVNQLKDLGNGMAFGSVSLPRSASAGHPFDLTKTVGKTPVATETKGVFVPVGAHTLSLEDFTPDRQARAQALDEAHKKVTAIYAKPGLSQSEKDHQAVTVYEKAERDMRALHEAKLEKNPTNLFTMYKAGVKPGWDQYKQMVLAPMIYKDSMDRKIPTPVTKSYAEGLDVGGYWTQMHGARRGSVMKVQEVQEPGYMSKLLMNNMMHLTVNEHDCGTDKGIALHINERDVHDRHLQQDFTHGSLHLPAGTLLTPDVVGKIRAAKKDAKIVVRSPLKCESEKGICQKCSGLDSGGHPYALGTNIGVHSAHAVGERAIQLTLKSFHTGGVGEQHGSKILNSFARFEQLMSLPQKLPNESSLAMTSGTITKIEPTTTGVDVFIGNRKHHVGKDAGGLPLHQNLPNAEAVAGYTHWNPPVVGAKVEAGDHLSDPNRTILNPHRLYEATGSMDKVQHHLANEIYGLYEKEGIKRRHVETVIKAMGNLTEIVHPGDHDSVLRGEYRPLSVVNRMNQNLVKQGLQPIEHKPVLKGISVMPLELQEDWMAKLQHQRLRTTLADAAALGEVSHIHGTHPIPGVVFGAEFGLTQKQSLQPGREHLKNVPGHHY
jgi:DNA-directed RNA polymerase subunit beta'